MQYSLLPRLFFVRITAAPRNRRFNRTSTMAFTVSIDNHLAVGIGIAHEITIPKHSGMKVFVMSLITNKVVTSEDSDVQTNHEEVLATSAKRAETMKSFVERLVECLNV
nr:purine nucleoside phosphorylase [Hymenolepis microstoma]